MSFADYLEKMLIKRGFWSEVECDHVFDSPGCDIYAVAVAFATTVNNQTEQVADCILYATYIF